MIWKLKCINDEYNNVDILPIYSLFNKSCPEFYGDHTLFHQFCQRTSKSMFNLNKFLLQSFVISFASGTDDEAIEIKTNQFSRILRYWITLFSKNSQ